MSNVKTIILSLGLISQFIFRIVICMKHGFDENRSQEVISTLTIILIGLNNICFVIIGTKGKHNEKNTEKLFH